MQTGYRTAAEIAASEWEEAAALKYRMTQFALNYGWTRLAIEHQAIARKYAAEARAVLAALIGGSEDADS
jgi:hypothetical protein